MGRRRRIVKKPRRRQCRYKTRYPDKMAALKILRSIQLGSKREEVPSRVYPCVYCRGYHLTKQPKNYDVETAESQSADGEDGLVAC